MNKKIKYLLLTFMALGLSLNVVQADTGSNIGGGGNFNNSYCNASTPQCYNTSYFHGVPYELNGIRVTIVDSGGNRVGGTTSVDYTNVSSLVNGSSLRGDKNGEGIRLYAGGGHYRNEVIAWGQQPGSVGATPSIKYWASLPRFLNKGTNNILRTFFLSLAKTRPAELQSLLSDVGYSYSGNTAMMENHYLLVEPLLYVKLFSGMTSTSLGVYYGTATEVYAMFKGDGRLIGSGLWQSQYPLSITVNETKAGLTSIAGVNGGFWGNYMLTNYGVASGHVWMSDLIKGKCTPGTEDCPDDTSSCDTSPTTSFPNTCTGEVTSGFASDTNNWSCIFKQGSASKNTFNGQFYQSDGTNKYCTIACREDISYYFSGQGLTVEAGTKFTVGAKYTGSGIRTLAPVTFKGTSECRTGYRSGTSSATINYSQFVSDYASADVEMVKQWDLYQIDLAKQRSLANIVEVAGGTHIHYEYLGQTVPVLVSPAVPGHRDPDTGKWIPKKEAVYEDVPVPTPVPYKHKVYYGSNESYSGTYYSWSGRMQYARGETCSDYDYGNTSWGASANAYNNAKAYRDSLILDLRKCNNYQKTYNEFDPQVSVAYSETKYKSSYQLEREGMVTSHTTFYSKGGGITGTMGWNTDSYNNGSSVNDQNNSYGLIKYTNRHDCSSNGNSCRIVYNSVAYPANDYIYQTTIREYNYSLPDNVYRYVNKDGVSFNTESDAISSGIAYKDLGYSNLPISYTTKEGSYDYYYEFYFKANGQANLFGTRQKYYIYNPNNMFAVGGTSSLSGLTRSSAMGYKCTYDVQQEIIEKPTDGNGGNGGNDVKDINVIYRPISLGDPFPGLDGEGRKSGTNWIGYTSDGTPFINAYITNNRGVASDSVYDEEPMYEFVLTPNNIRAIRNYNNTKSDNYNDFTLACEQGKYCRSEFLAKGFENGYFSNNQAGSCFNVSNDRWDSCRYTHIGG